MAIYGNGTSNLPSGYVKIAIENGEIVDFSHFHSMVMFHSYVNVYQRVFARTQILEHGDLPIEHGDFP